MQQDVILIAEAVGKLKTVRAGRFRASSEENMAIVAGIDEAGYGPLLGPLASSVTTFLIPNALSHQNLWHALSSSISPRPSSRSGRITVADSKKLFSRAGGLAGLERTALTFLHLLGRPSASMGQLLGSLRADCAEQMVDYPWYVNESIEIPLAADRRDLATSLNALRLDTQRKGIELLEVGCQPVLVGRYNELVDKTRNKASLLFSLTGRFLAELVERYARDGLVIYVDKQGGRSRYRSLLQRCFPDWQLRILEETGQASAYQMNRGAESWQVHFEAKSEERHFTVALASIYAKYVRELFMELLNRYWIAQVPGLRPTAGYYTDGKRFLAEIGPACKKLGTPVHKLVRSR